MNTTRPLSKRKIQRKGLLQRTLPLLMSVLLLFTGAQAVFAGETVGKYGMVPIYGRDIADGTYEVTVECNSIYFLIEKALLTVNGDDLTLHLTLSTHSYLKLFRGTAAEAAAAPESEHIGYTEEDWYYTFTFPVDALNQAFPCASYSKRRQIWYDRDLLIEASSLPAEAIAFELPDYALIEKGLEALENDPSAGAEGAGNTADKAETAGAAEEPESALPSQITDTANVLGGAAGSAYEPVEPISLPMEDGEYSIEVSMTGGSGRAGISSPTLLLIQDGDAYVKLLWSSPNYDWMIVGGELYKNETTDGGNSTFTIPIPAMDTIVPVIADTTAMGEPVAIEYSLTFYRNTIGAKGLIPQEAAKKVLLIALIIIVAGAVLNHFTKKRRRS